MQPIQCTWIKLNAVFWYQPNSLPSLYILSSRPRKSYSPRQIYEGIFCYFFQVVKVPSSRRLTGHRFLQIGYFYFAYYKHFGTVVDQVLLLSVRSLEDATGINPSLPSMDWNREETIITASGYRNGFKYAAVLTSSLHFCYQMPFEVRIPIRMS